MSSVFYKIKEEVRILGLDDSAFDRNGGKCLVVGAFFRGGLWLDGVVSTYVEVDGVDATSRLVELVSNIRFKDLRIIMLDGLGFAGFNLVDIEVLYEKTGIPVIVVVRRMPDFEGIFRALRNLDEFEFRAKCVEKAGEPVPVETRGGSVFIQFKGISREDAGYITRLSSTRSMIPEPLRVAHLIGQGVVLGESKGRA